MFSKRFGVTLVAALTVAALFSPSVAAQSDDATDQPTSSGRGHVVLAYYYTWWEPEVLSDALYTPSDHIAAGARQIADDPALLRKHIQEAKSAGIDGFIVNRVSDLALLLPLAREANFSVTMQLDATHGFGSQLASFYQYASDPAMVRYQGHPVLFFWQSQTLAPESVSAERQSIDPDHNVFWIADGDQFGILGGDAWDGISPYAIAWSANPRGQLVSWAGKARSVAADKLYIPPVSPGCDDHVVRPTTCMRDRTDGEYYDAAWQGALASNPGWAVVVSTWNEWMEATQIEPAEQYGDEYLQITRQYADTFKGG
jgi:hypothetical protein